MTWLNRLTDYLTNDTVGRLLLILAVFLLAYLLHRLAGRLARRIANLNRFTSRGRRIKEERRATLRGLIASAVTVSIGLFVDVSTLVWMVGLFSAAFGLGARPLIADFLTGISFIFEDTFDVGEKVEILGVEGVVEKVNLRTTLLRAPGGELFVVPNGEVRMVRNFSRGRFSLVKVQINVSTANLGTTVVALETLGEEAMADLPNLLEPWQVIGTGDHLGETTELTVLAKAKFGKGAEMRPRLLALLGERLGDVTLAPAENV